MPNNHPAFSSGDYVQFASIDVLREVQAKFGPEESQGRKLIHENLAADMTAYPGARVRIKEVTIYHFGTVLYEFDEVEGCWLESTIVDWTLAAPPTDSDLYLPASQFYRVTTDAEENQAGMVHVEGIEDQMLYCSLYRHYAKREAKCMNEVARLRTKANFASRYGFDRRIEEIKSS